MRRLILPLVLTALSACAQDPKTASATVAGIIVNGAGNPVAGATIILAPIFRPGMRPDSMPAALNAVSDTAGKFSFTQVKPEQYALSGMHPAYFTAIYRGAAASFLTLASGQELTDIRLTLVDPANVSGRVLDEQGNPLASARVELVRSGNSFVIQGGQVPIGINSGADGTFQLERVQPGKYAVHASTDFTASLRSGKTSVGPGSVEGAPFDVAPGQNVALGDIKAPDWRWVHVQGKVTGPSDLLTGARVVRLPESGSGNIEWNLGAEIHKDGSFDLVTPETGDFNIAAMTPSTAALIGWTHISEWKKALNGIVIDARAMPLNGYLKWEGTVPAGSAQQRMAILAAVGVPLVHLNSVVNRDNSLTFAQVAPGRYTLNIFGLPQGSYLKSLSYKGVEVPDQILEVRAGDKGNAEVLISANAAVLTGTLQDGDGKPVRGIATLISEAQSAATSGPTAITGSDPQGQFKLPGVAPGKYRVFGWETISPAMLNDPNFTKPFESLGEHVELVEGANATVVIKRISTARMQAAGH